MALNLHFGTVRPPYPYSVGAALERRRGRNSDPSGLRSRDDDGDVVARPMDLADRIRAVRARIGVNLDLTVGQVDDPVNRDAGAGIGRQLGALVPGETRIGDLD